MRALWICVALVIWPSLVFSATPPTGHSVRIREIASVEGVRENPLLGYGIVVGLNGTGDRSQTIFTTQTLSGILQRLGVQTPPTTMMVKNVAAVMVTASLPPFAVHGTQIDATVSSMGDAKSLEGGTLLLTPLYGADGKVYAAAQGTLTVGGYSASSGGNSKQLNHPTVGRLSGGAIVERDLVVPLESRSVVSLLLRDPDFRTAQDVVEAVNAGFGSPIAKAHDSRQVDVMVPEHATVTEVLARVEMLEVPVRSGARVVINERTGTVVLGGEVQLGAVSIFHGNLSIEISHATEVSQPPPSRMEIP